MLSWLKWLLFVFLTSVTVQSYGQTIVATIGEYPPYTSKTDPNARLAEEIVIAAYESSGYQVKLRRVPWKRAMEEAKAGKVDISFGWFKTEEREKHFYYSDPLYPIEEVFFYHKDSNFTWSDMSDLENYNIGATLGYSHEGVLRGAGLTVDVAKTDALAIQKVFRRRVDATPIDAHVGYYILAEFPQEVRDVITHNDKPLLRNHQYVIAGKVKGEYSANLIEQFNTGLQTIRDNGTFDKILSNYTQF
nr:transporter substrate-binding domain-containing protein [Vibrio sinus]